MKGSLYLRQRRTQGRHCKLPSSTTRVFNKHPFALNVLLLHFEIMNGEKIITRNIKYCTITDMNVELSSVNTNRNFSTLVTKLAQNSSSSRSSSSGSNSNNNNNNNNNFTFYEAVTSFLSEAKLGCSVGQLHSKSEGRFTDCLFISWNWSVAFAPHSQISWHVATDRGTFTCYRFIYCI
jgi:hypothetical protein